MQQVNYVIWDWNGTLLDDVDVCVQVMNSILTERGIPCLDKKIYREIFSFPVIDYYRKAGLDLTQEPFERLAHIYIDRYQRESAACGLYKEATSVLASLRNRAIRQVVLSATKADQLTVQMAPYEISGFFDELLGLDSIYAISKIDVGVNWVTTRHINPAGVVLIGDTVHDYEVASRLGCRCVLVAQGHQSHAVLCSPHVTVPLSTIYQMCWIISCKSRTTPAHLHSYRPTAYVTRPRKSHTIASDA